MPIDCQGMLVIQDFAPIFASGLSLVPLRKVCEERVMGIHNSEIYITLGTLRQIGVLVVENV